MPSTHFNFRDITGQKFGRLTVISHDGIRNHNSYWLCRCDCGTERIVSGGSLKAGKTRSCGCLNVDLLKSRVTVHGKTNTKAYRIWSNMLTRCGNPVNPAYPNYGGRGIYVCDRWRDSFQNFYADMGNPPPRTSLDRINNDGPYSPENCRWATTKEQCRNTRFNRIIEFNGQSKTLVEWSEQTGIKECTIAFRLDHGWPLDVALSRKPSYAARCWQHCHSTPGRATTSTAGG